MSSFCRNVAALVCCAVLAMGLSGCRSRSQTPPADGGTELAPAGAPAMLIDVPEEYKVSARKGADFDVFYIQREKTLKGETPRDGMGVYVGHAPDFAPPKEAETASGTIAGHPVTWYSWEDDTSDRTLLRVQTLVPDFFKGAKDQASGVAGLKVHIFIWAPGERRLNLLRDAAQSLRLK